MARVVGNFMLAILILREGHRAKDVSVCGDPLHVVRGEEKERRGSGRLKKAEKNITPIDTPNVKSLKYQTCENSRLLSSCVVLDPVMVNLTSLKNAMRGGSAWGVHGEKCRFRRESCRGFFVEES